MTYKIYLERQAKKDLQLLTKAILKDKMDKLLKKIKVDPYCTVPPYENLTGNLKGSYSRRINIKHRLVYQVYEKEKSIKIVRMWTHYE